MHPLHHDSWLEMHLKQMIVKQVEPEWTSDYIWLTTTGGSCKRLEGISI